MEYTERKDIPYFTDCAALVEDAGCLLLELQVVPQHGNVHVSAVISFSDASKDISVADCSKVHHALAPKLLSLLGIDEDHLSMEVSSPGLERKLKDAYEFSLFTGAAVKVWDKTEGDWRSGVIESSDSKQVTLKAEDGGTFSVAFENIAKAKLLNT